MNLAIVTIVVGLQLVASRAERSVPKSGRTYEAHRLVRGAESFLSETFHDEHNEPHHPWNAVDPNNPLDVVKVMLHADTHHYVSKIGELFYHIVEGSDPIVNGDSHFIAESHGEYDLFTPCGRLHADSVTDVMEEYLVDPKEAHMDHGTVEHVGWHPTDECLYHHNSLEIEGGMLGLVNVSCDDTLLASALVASVGVNQRFHFSRAEAYGVIAHVSFLNGSIELTDIVGDFLEPAHHRVFPHDMDQIFDELGKRVYKCAAQKTLRVHGIIGGGWWQLYTEYGGNESSPREFDIHYANAFEITYSRYDVPVHIHPGWSDGVSIEDDGSGEASTDGSTSWEAFQSMSTIGKSLTSNKLATLKKIALEASAKLSNAMETCSAESIENGCFVTQSLAALQSGYLDKLKLSLRTVHSPLFPMVWVGLVAIAFLIGVFRTRLRRRGYTSLAEPDTSLNA